MMKAGRILTYLFIICTGLSACNIVNPKEGIPTYVHIDSFLFENPNPALSGTGKQNITSVWAYLDGEAVGVFDLPATIPLLINGTRELQLAPGVNAQGLKDYMTLYPFFAFHNENIAEAGGTVKTLSPVTKYISDLKFWSEDFESSNSFIKISGDTAIHRVSGADSVFEGGGGGCIVLNSAMPTAESFAETNIDLSSTSYLEIHYKGTLAFQVGIYVIPNTGSETYAYLAGIKPKTEWGKFYVDIGTYAGQFASARKFGVIIRSTLEEGQTEGYLLLDNVKLVSY